MYIFFVYNGLYHSHGRNGWPLTNMCKQTSSIGLEREEERKDLFIQREKNNVFALSRVPQALALDRWIRQSGFRWPLCRA